MKSSHVNWQSLPGSFDALNTRQLFPSDNRFGIPTLPHVGLSALPHWLAPYRTRIRSDRGVADGAIHFFLDDYRFETVWSRPRKALQALQPYITLLSPDFSLFADYPRTLQLFNTYRNRWCGAFWIAQDFTVIPSVSWSAPDSFDFCFAGLPEHSLLAVSTVGIFRDADRQWFVVGFREMVERLSPTTVLCYGQPITGMDELATIKIYPDRWQGIRQARKAAR
jgi:hypothetical protein